MTDYNEIDKRLAVIQERVDTLVQRVGDYQNKMDEHQQKMESLNARVYNLEGWKRAIPVSSGIIVVLVIGLALGQVGIIGPFF